MPEFWVGKHQGEIGLEEYGNLLSLFPNYADKAIASALKGEGFRLKDVIRRAIILGGPEGAKWPRLHPHTLMIRSLQRTYRRRQSRILHGKKVRKWKGERHEEIDPKGFHPLQKLAGATRYFYSKDEHLVTVGFLASKARWLAKRHAQGFEIDVSGARARRFHFAARMPLAKGTRRLKVPPRPVVSVIFEKQGREIRQNVMQRTAYNITRYLARERGVELPKYNER